ncbi:MAG: branched-chain amino acid ABC transporter permease [Chthoniobacterales bacterium]
MKGLKKYAAIGFLAATLIAAGVLAFFSDQLDPSFIQVLTYVGINITLAVSLNLIIGYTGQFSLCHAAFMAVGAYTSALLTTNAHPFITSLSAFVGTSFGTEIVFLGALVLGGLVAALAGLLVGVPSLRLHGDYLAIVTLGFGEIIRVLLLNTNVLGGAAGMTGIPAYTNLFWVFAVAAITIYAVWGLINSTYGRGFLAVRDDEIAAEAMGINSTKYKVVAFVIGAFFAGVAGGLYAHCVQFISPERFGFMQSIEVVVMVILGGMGQMAGVVGAAGLLTFLNEWLRNLAEYRIIVYALLLILLMILRPQGLLGGLSKFVRFRKPTQP